MDSGSVNAISCEWDKLLENNMMLIQYMIDALMLTPQDTSRRIVNGKQQKAVQIYSLKSSIQNNADPNKRGFIYLAMRSIHYWKTTYERAIQNPEDIEDKKGNYVSRHLYQSVLDDFHIEIQKLQNVMYSKNLVPKEEYETLEKEYFDVKKKYEKLDTDYNKNMKIAIENEKKYANQEVIRLESKAKFLEEELRKMSKISAKNQ